MAQCVAVCGSVLQRVWQYVAAVCGSVLQRVWQCVAAVCGNVLQPAYLHQWLNNAPEFEQLTL